MRILVLVHRYMPALSAGAETHLHSMLTALAGRGHQVDVTLSRQSGDPYQLDGVAVWPTDDASRDVFRWLAGADVIITHLENTPRAAALGRLNGVPTVAVLHNLLPQTLEVLNASWARVDLVVANSYWMAAALDRPSVTVRPIANPATYATTPGDRVTLVNLRRTAYTPTSTNGHSKGGELFSTLAGLMLSTQFLGVTGAYGVQQNLDVHPNVEVVGHVPHGRMVAEVYARTRVLLMPSSYESWGRVASEAMCSGIPVIAHPTPGLVECLGPTGTFIDRDDPDAWVAELRRLDDPNVWAERSARAKARAAELERVRPTELAAWCDAVEALQLVEV